VDAPIVIYGEHADDIFDNPGIEYRNTQGMTIPDGSTVFHAVCANGQVYIGTLAAYGNPLTGTYQRPSYVVFDPESDYWQARTIKTSLNKDAVSPFDGFSAGNVQSFNVVDGRVFGFVAVPYRGWRISDYGHYPSIMEIDATGALVQQFTTEQLQALADDPADGLLFCPDAVNTFGETYATSLSIAHADALPNGWIACASYFNPPGAPRSGVIMCIDQAGHIKTAYQIPDCDLSDGTQLIMAPKFVYTDDTATDPTDMRININYDVFQVVGSTVHFYVQEFSINAVTGAVTPVTALMVGAHLDDQADLSTYTAKLGGQYAADGSFWGHTSDATGFGFNRNRMEVWLKSGGERSYVAQAPAVPGWETDGPVRVVPDFALPSFVEGGQLNVAHFEEPVSGGQVFVGHGGKVSPVVPDSPLALRPNLLVNGEVATDITSWTAFGLSGNTVWDAGDGGRLKFTANGAPTSTWSNPLGLAGGTLLPEGSDGLPIWALARFKPNTTARSVFTSLAFYDEAGLGLGSAASKTTLEIAGRYVDVGVADEVPDGAVSFRLFCQIPGAASLEVHFMDRAYVGLCPVELKDEWQLRKGRLPMNRSTSSIWPGGGASTDHAVDGKGRAWLPLTTFEHDDDLVWPLPVRLYLASIDLPQILA
jgi:hypothetical protein